MVAGALRPHTLGRPHTLAGALRPHTLICLKAAYIKVAYANVAKRRSISVAKNAAVVPWQRD